MTRHLLAQLAAPAPTAQLVDANANGHAILAQPLSV